MNKEKTKELQIIPLGGLGEVGRNMMLLEWNKKILIIDMGFRMPNENMPGIDYIIPNTSYLKEREKDILGVVFTHGHYDHIGAVPYLANQLGNPPMFASPLTRGIIIKRQEDFPNQKKPDISEVKIGSKIKLGVFDIEFFHQNHNIADNLGLLIKTPVGKIVHTSDFKFDKTPVNDYPTNFSKLKEIGNQEILLMLIDSTGAENEGHSLSEKIIMENLEEIFKISKGRIIAATFSSLINRIQQLVILSEKYGRKVIVEGNGMKTNIEICRNLKHLKIKKGTLLRSKDIDSYPDNKITVLCTGAQGEGKAALMRIANKEHKNIVFKKNDSVIFSSSVIPGNERVVQELKDEILRQGAKVFHYKMMDIHAGGHAQKEELKEMIEIMRPKFLIPIHGQYSMCSALKDLAVEDMNFPEKNILIVENGNVVHLSPSEIRLDKKMVPYNNVMVDGLGIGDVGEVVLKDRKALAEDGMFVIIVAVDKKERKTKGSPDIISRGFIYLRESKNLLYQTRKKVVEIVNKSYGSGQSVDPARVKEEIKNKVSQFLYQKTERRPIIISVIIEI